MGQLFSWSFFVAEVHAFSKYKLSDEGLESWCSLSLMISDLDVKANNPRWRCGMARWPCNSLRVALISFMLWLEWMQETLVDKDVKKESVRRTIVLPSWSTNISFYNLWYFYSLKVFCWNSANLTCWSATVHSYEHLENSKLFFGLF